VRATTTFVGIGTTIEARFGKSRGARGSARIDAKGEGTGRGMGDVEEPDRRASNQPSSRLFQTTQRAEDVQAWAQRMRDKRAARQAEANGEAPPASTYWSSDALYEESRHVAEEERLTANTTESRNALLASFGLGPSATPHDVTQAFKQLAKLHHPDRYVSSSPEVQAHHSEAMTRINSAYRALKTAMR